MRMIILFIVFIASPAGASPLEAINENKKGIGHLEKEEPHLAEKRFLDALAADPFNPAVRLNLGWTYEYSADPKKKDKTFYEKALKEYESVLRSPKLPEDLEYAAHFNAGNAAAGLGQIDLALLHYQAALDLTTDPERKRAVKNNIELLFMGGQKGQGQGQGQGEQSGESEGQGESEPNQNPNEENEKQQKKPQHFTEDEIQNILEELKAQENKIRALEYGNKDGKQQTPEKDW